jgi:IclR family pca regulon transcriptional regulator
LEKLTARTVSSVAALRGEIARARSQGWVLVNQELEEGLRALAVPIRDRSGAVVAALNVSAHASRTSLEAMRRDLLPPLLKAAARVEADLPARTRR